MSAYIGQCSEKPRARERGRKRERERGREGEKRTRLSGCAILPTKVGHSWVRSPSVFFSILIIYCYIIYTIQYIEF